ncbi:MAG TPA: apolipoprotein N-acyltransferase, partial [Actinomycetota bacterium]|nr:apolipoprotein N-acyltransferase [Actinomycetota bacterium]
NVPVVGFTWGQLAQSQHNVTHLLPIAGLGGAWALSGLVAAVNASAAAALVKARDAKLRTALPAGIVAVALLVAPFLLPRAEASGPSLSVAIVQGNVPRPFVGTVDEKSLVIFSSHADLTETLADSGVDLVVWPESAVGVDMNQNEVVAKRLSEAARSAGAEMIVGGNLIAGDGLYEVLAFHVAPTGEIVDRYQKTHLVPFGEYVPGRRFLGWIPMLQQVQGDAVAGNEPKVFNLDQGPVAPVISFEGDFGSLVRDRIGDAGGRLLVVATNTSTWEDSWASAQHVAFSKLRAAENGVWVIHAALSGISAFVAPDGTVVKETGLWTEEILRADVRFATEPTLYARTGDWAPLACLAATAGLLLVAVRRRRGSVA